MKLATKQARAEGAGADITTKTLGSPTDCLILVVSFRFRSEPAGAMSSSVPKRFGPEYGH